MIQLHPLNSEGRTVYINPKYIESLEEYKEAEGYKDEVDYLPPNRWHITMASRFLIIITLEEFLKYDLIKERR